MKKFYLFLLAAAPLLATTACSDEETTSSATYVCCNLITPLDGGDSYATKAQYAFEFNNSNSTLAIGSGNLVINNQNYTFNTPQIPYTQQALSTNTTTTYLRTSFGPTNANSGNLQVSNITGYITNAYKIYVIAYPGIGYAAYNDMLVLNYQVGNDYKVQTFPADASYSGSLVLSPSEGSGENSVQSSAGIRIIMDMDNNCATVVLGNLSLKPDTDPVNMVVKNVPLSFGHGKYLLKMDEVVPEYFDGTKWISAPDYKITNLVIQSSGDNLLGISAAGTIATGYNLTFSGSYLLI